MMFASLVHSVSLSSLRTGRIQGNAPRDIYSLTFLTDFEKWTVRSGGYDVLHLSVISFPDSFDCWQNHVTKTILYDKFQIVR